MNDVVILMIVAIGFASLGFGLWNIYQWVKGDYTKTIDVDDIIDPDTGERYGNGP